MNQPLSGPGVGLAVPQNLYPSELFNAPYDWSTNKVGLAPGDAIPIPAGDWYINTNYAQIEILNPISGVWEMGVTPGWAGGIKFIKSDGFNCRLANRTGCPVGAAVTGGGSAYVQATTTVSPTVGNSTWAPIVGGSLNLQSILNAGAGYGVAPLVPIGAPPSGPNALNGVGGMAAAAYATISAGTVASISFTNQGAGYSSVPTNNGQTGQIVLLPNPTDPSINTVTNATVQLSLTGAGAITGVLCTNSGAPLTTAQIATGLTLTAAGAGTGATISGLVLQCITGLSLTNVGGGYIGGILTTSGGDGSSTTTQATPEKLHLGFRPRQPQIALAGTGALTSIAAITDAGLFLSTPAGVVINQGVTTTAATVALQMGGVADFVTIQPAP